MQTPDAVSFRPLAAADIGAALALWNRTEMMGLGAGDDPAGLERYLARNPGISQAAEAGGKLVATLMAGHDGRRGWLYHLATEPAYRRRGIARMLVERATARLAEAGIVRLYLMIYEANEAGQVFWQSLGWRRMDEAVAVMTLDLPGNERFPGSAGVPPAC